MRRRRKKSPLLTRIILISIAAHAIALPIAAHYGAFEKIQRQFGQTRVVMINTPPLEEKKRATEKQKPKKSQQTSKKGPTNAHHAGHKGPSKPNPNAPKVLASTSPEGAGEGPTVENNGTGKAGVLPTGPATSANANPPPPPPPPTTTTVKPPPVTNPTPPVTNPESPPKPAAPVAKKFVQVETTYAPDPVIPDDLRSEPFEKTLVVEADVSTEGSPQNVHVVDSTGNTELDGIGLDTAKKYRFKPATLGDEPVEGHVRFRIIFKVE